MELLISCEKTEMEYEWIKIFNVSNGRIARGRNLVIRKVKHSLIAVTDAGCRLDEQWLENLVGPFSDNKVDIVAGVYRVLWEMDFQYFQGLVVIPCVGNMYWISRMSSRSLAFRKKCWEEVRGYPEQYDMGEQTCIHTQTSEKRDTPSFLAENAIVRWQMRKSWEEPG